jgi:non-lysosomal glucosylceramidase
LSIVKAARDRYDGRRRNPWDEVECGHHYARAMSSWGLLLALGGCSYSGTDSKMGFDPKISADDFRTVWTAGSGWGTYAQNLSGGNTAKLKIEVGSGDLSLREFFFTAPASSPKAKVTLVRGTLGGAETKASFRRDGNVVHVLWRAPIMVTPGAPLELEIEY